MALEAGIAPTGAASRALKSPRGLTYSSSKSPEFADLFFFIYCTEILSISFGCFTGGVSFGRISFGFGFLVLLIFASSFALIFWFYTFDSTRDSAASDFS